MKLKMTIANTFKIEPGKKYLVIINIDEEQWLEQQKDDLMKQLAPFSMSVVFLPKGAKYKVLEGSEESSGANTKGKR